MNVYKWYEELGYLIMTVAIGISIFVMAVFLVNAIGKCRCKNLTEIHQTAGKFNILNGCYLEKDGKMIPAASYEESLVK